MIRAALIFVAGWLAFPVTFYLIALLLNAAGLPKGGF